MGMSKSQRIILLLTIDSLFFLLELVVGYAVHSLALVADSFHMLNDVLSLCVGLWAVKVANQKTTSKMYTYGWQRAETLGALVNGVFLVALCLSIFLEAIQRLVEPQEVRNPKLVCIVGSCGLLSNIVGLVLFHEHSHGPGGHAHAAESLDSAEQGRMIQQGKNPAMASDEGSPIDVVTPVDTFDPWQAEESRTAKSTPDERDPSNPSTKRSRESETRHRRSRHYSESFSRSLADKDNIYLLPASLRQDIIQAGRLDDVPSSDSDTEVFGGDNGANDVSEHSRLLRHSDGPASYAGEDGGKFYKQPQTTYQDVHDSHNHAKRTHGGEKKGHSHGDLNMRGVFLHVMGDALGNIGVIASALIIWLTDYPWRFYVDPGISLLITVIILCSAIPLCKAASRILLQAVPAGLSIDHIIQDIENLKGVSSCHHLHVWQLNDTKLVASLHIKIDCEIKGEGSARYMRLARQVRDCLHAYGIHSSTIQPEFHPESDLNEAPVGSSRSGNSEYARPASKPLSLTNSSRGGETRACLLECGDECALGPQCCPGESTIRTPGPSENGHSR